MPRPRALAATASSVTSLPLVNPLCSSRRLFTRTSDLMKLRRFSQARSLTVRMRPMMSCSIWDQRSASGAVSLSDRARMMPLGTPSMSATCENVEMERE